MKKGFTLMEILMVVAILILLAASGIPYLIKGFSSVNEIANLDVNYYLLHDASLAVRNAIEREGISSISKEEKTLKINDMAILDNVIAWEYEAIQNNESKDIGYACKLTTENNVSGSLFIRFIAAAPESF